MRRRSLAAVVVPVLAGGLVAGMSPALADPAEALNTTHIPARYAKQALDWHLCTAEELPSPVPGLECATYRTPRDWERPHQRPELTIAISRLAATGKATASVLTNPGGPGGPGRTLPGNFRGQSKLREHQEVIGIDTRGTGKSTNVSCGGAIGSELIPDARDRNPANLDLVVDTVRRQAADCQKASGELGPFINTFQMTKDLDLLRVLLRRDKINWIGYSAGTWLGAHYAQRFPNRVGRFVLDSATEFTASWQQSFDWQPMSFERRWRQDFLPWIARYDGKYHFGATAEAARQNYERIRQALRRKPVVIDGIKVGPTELDLRTIGELKSKARFTALAEDLLRLRTLTEPGTPEQAKAEARDGLKEGVARQRAEAPDALLATLFNTLCNDGPWTGDRESIIRRSQQFLDRGQTLHSGWMGFQSCAFWGKPSHPLPKLDGKGVPPVLIVHAEHDGSTAIEGARRARAGFANSRLLTVTGEGDHGVYGRGNPAVDKIVNAYLVDGVVPADQNVPGMPLPVPAG
ncbi:alpha/beta hydrolase [Crossiella sp. SN42]|uniref:alpha/beta hydrolase n=1 Tax=Crossiella sp. SN42 TaxID=2944808 RepID=UPI00207CA87B|nr:alpha/beta hydrolase [Crossiella sp. SN42]MCO1577322.1 alpha/beta hydrolase [Crossiella sp. SN42]